MVCFKGMPKTVTPMMISFLKSRTTFDTASKSGSSKSSIYSLLAANAKPLESAKFSSRFWMRPEGNEEVGARQRAEPHVAFAGRVADVEGDEQVLGGMERVFHRSDRHRGVQWDGPGGCDVGESRLGVIGIAGPGGLGEGDLVEREVGWRGAAPE